MPQLSPPAWPHPFGTTRGSLPDSAYENQRETARFAPENRVLIGSLRRSAARPTGDRGYVARPLIKSIDVPTGWGDRARGTSEEPQSRAGETARTHPPARAPRDLQTSFPPPPGCTDIPSTVQPFFCAHKSVAGRIATMMMDRAARHRAGRRRKTRGARRRSRFNAPHRARTDCRGTKDLCPKYAECRNCWRAMPGSAEGAGTTCWD
jgi:hypothetical protein